MERVYITNIGLLQTPEGSIPAAGPRQSMNVRLENAAIVVEDGVIAAVLDKQPTPEAGATVIDAGGRLCTPGLVDCHTHLVFSGWRQHEIPLKLRGAGYLDILKAGGGILDTVRKTREASSGELFGKAKEALDHMARIGVTTVEAKSGYGLNLEEELKQLRVAKSLNESHAVDIVSTFMGAHAIPDEYKGRADDYIDMLIETVLPEVRTEGLAEFCDVFCEDSVFNVDQSRKILQAAAQMGLKPKIHADEIEEIGGAVLAGELKAVSAEHLIATGQRGIEAMAAGGVIAALLPATSFYLNKTYAPARQMMEAGIPVAIASDYNPGSCPSFNLQLCMNLGYLKYRLYPEEVLTAVTLNAACAIGRGESIGTLEPGKKADLVLWDAPDVETLCYRFGLNQAAVVIKNGSVI